MRKKVQAAAGVFAEGRQMETSNIRGSVYVIQMEGHPWLKIGRTTNVTVGAKERLAGMQTGCPVPLHLVKEYRCESPETMEWLVHKMLASVRRRGEWFETTLEEIDKAMALVQKDPTFWMTEQQRADYQRSLERQREVLRLVAEQDARDIEKARRNREKRRAVFAARAALRECEATRAGETVLEDIAPPSSGRVHTSLRLRAQRSAALWWNIGLICSAVAVVLRWVGWCAAELILWAVMGETYLKRWQQHHAQSSDCPKAEVTMERWRAFHHRRRRHWCVNAWVQGGTNVIYPLE